MTNDARHPRSHFVGRKTNLSCHLSSQTHLSAESGSNDSSLSLSRSPFRLLLSSSAFHVRFGAKNKKLLYRKRSRLFARLYLVSM